MENESSNKSVIFGVVGGLVGLVVFVIILAACGAFHQHEFGEWKTVKAVTCTEDGMKEHVCECGEKETQVIPATGHNWKDATCESPKKCANCGKTEGEALGHTTDSGTCSRCGKNLGKWVTFNIHDNMGNSTGTAVGLKEKVQGIFSNSATTNSKCLVDVRAEDGWMCFALYDYGTYQVKNSSSRYVDDYGIVVECSNGARFDSNGAKCLGVGKGGVAVNPWSDFQKGVDLNNWLIKQLQTPNNTLKIYLYEVDHPTTHYLFSVESSNFGDLY